MTKSDSIREGLGWIFAAQAEWIRRRLAASVGRDASEDLTQEAFLRLAASQTVGEARHPRALLMTVANNLARDEYRHQARRGGAQPAFQPDIEDGEPWSHPDQETTLLLKQVILGLPPIYRETFILNRFAGLSYQQIAVHFGITAKAVEYRMARALALCQEALRD